MDMDPPVTAQFRDQLVVPHVYGHDFPRTAAEEDVGETARGGAGVEASPFGDDDVGKAVERACELVSGAADVFIPFGGVDGQPHGAADLRRGLRRGSAGDADASLGDQAAGMRA
ncbi:hypothetical protein GCM10008096_21320 [Zhihengliuella salsuginis]|uniref:Uncharacterized protein n=1 Tax=Zhihengliuella salsuginis TaxID=578222 RepID=A0ABQ3GKF9_9MICC|nr:hypothetical protein GCM10008096_21320 [Zhihengliuella salsuginis]